MGDPLRPRVFAVADDLSGAVEAAAALGPGQLPLVCLDGPSTRPRTAGTPVVMLDLNSRNLPAPRAAAALEVTLASEHSGAADHLFVKIDSLLRGPIAALAGVARATGRPIIFAPSVPAFGRVVRNGQVRRSGLDREHAGLPTADGHSAPESIAEALWPLPIAVVTREQLPRPDLRHRLAMISADGRVPVCDAEDDEDLDRIAAAALEIPGAILFGAGGLAAAVGRRLHGRAVPVAAPRRTPPDAVLVVVGTAAPVARQQLAMLEDAGARHTRVYAHERSDGLLPSPDGTAASSAAPAAQPRVTVLSFADETSSPTILSPHVAKLLASRAAAMLCRRPRTDLVLTGGETARAVLDAVGVRSLRPFATVHSGAIASWTDTDDRVVVTRPGSIGGPTSLDRIVRFLMPLDPEDGPG